MLMNVLNVPLCTLCKIKQKYIVTQSRTQSFFHISLFSFVPSYKKQNMKHADWTSYCAVNKENAHIFKFKCLLFLTKATVAATVLHTIKLVG